MFRSFAVAVVLVVASSCASCGTDRLKNVETVIPPPVDAGSNCTAEVCNGQDDDCNGAIDDVAMLDCGVGACHRTVPGCNSGAPATCTPLPPSTEICNGIDDDCNGTVDDSLMPEMCGVGECAAVSTSCTNGVPAACMPGAPGTETCNGKDDNCNGTVDEGLISNTTGDVRITNNPATSDFVYIGRSNTGFGVVWQDGRAGASGQIYYAGLSSQGTRTSTSDIRVSNTTGVSAHPAIAWNGQSWGLVYSDDNSGDRKLYFRALAANGNPSAGAVGLTTSVGPSDWPDLVWTGQSFAMAWEDGRLGANKQDLFFLRFDKNGTRLGGEVQVTTDPARQSSPILKWNGTEFGLAWTDYRNAGNREIYFRRLAADGSPLGAEVRVTNDGADSAWPDLAWNDVAHEWALVWHDTRDGNSEVYFARLNSSGVKQGNDVRLTNATGFSGYPSIDWNGFQYGVSWQDDRVTANFPAIYFAQVNAMGAKNGTDVQLSSGNGVASFTTALWNGQTFAFCWRDDRNGATNTEIYFALVGCP
ncbi:MAG: MopE-related protein [Myxococcaceae bacterium]